MATPAKSKLLWQQAELAGLRTLFRGNAEVITALNVITYVQSRLTTLGVDYPTLSEFVARVNAGEHDGGRVLTLLTIKAEYCFQLNQLNEGRINWQRVVERGGHNAAVDWLNQKITHLDVSIATGGLGDMVNITNYHRYLQNLEPTEGGGHAIH